MAAPRAMWTGSAPSSHSFTAPVIFKHWWSTDHPPLGSLWIALNMGSSAARRTSSPRRGSARGCCSAPRRRRSSCGSPRSAASAQGLVAAAVFVLMPRLFAHGHFANLEMATLLLWLLTVIAFERGIERRGWSVACGVFFGLALLTKINAVFLPVLLLPWGFLFHGRKALRNAVGHGALRPADLLRRLAGDVVSPDQTCTRTWRTKRSG